MPSKKTPLKQDLCEFEYIRLQAEQSMAREARESQKDRRTVRQPPGKAFGQDGEQLLPGINTSPKKSGPSIGVTLGSYLAVATFSSFLLLNSTTMDSPHHPVNHHQVSTEDTPPDDSSQNPQLLRTNVVKIHQPNRESLIMNYFLDSTARNKTTEPR